MDIIGNLNCRNCGAPVTSEICPYCGSKTGLTTETADMEYPVIECKEANIGFWTTVFPLAFALGFGFFGFAFPIMMSSSADDPAGAPQPWFIYLFCLPFAAVGIGAAVITILPIIRWFRLRSRGKHITATVYGYVNDNVLINGRPAQVVKLLAETPVGRRFLMYQLGGTRKPYGINTELDLLVYKDYFMIVKKKEHINW